MLSFFYATINSEQKLVKIYDEGSDYLFAFDNVKRYYSKHLSLPKKESLNFATRKFIKEFNAII